MKTVEFPCWTNFGGGHSVDWEVEVDLTDAEYDLLASVIESEPVEDFYKCNALKSIFKKVYEIAVNTATADAFAYDEDLKAKYGSNPNWRADDLYSIGVEYPDL